MINSVRPLTSSDYATSCDADWTTCNNYVNAPTNHDYLRAFVNEFVEITKIYNSSTLRRTWLHSATDGTPSPTCVSFLSYSYLIVFEAMRYLNHAMNTVPMSEEHSTKCFTGLRRLFGKPSEDGVLKYGHAHRNRLQMLNHLITIRRTLSVSELCEFIDFELPKAYLAEAAKVKPKNKTIGCSYPSTFSAMFISIVKTIAKNGTITPEETNRIVETYYAEHTASTVVPTTPTEQVKKIQKPTNEVVPTTISACLAELAKLAETPEVQSKLLPVLQKTIIKTRDDVNNVALSSLEKAVAQFHGLSPEELVKLVTRHIYADK